MVLALTVKIKEEESTLKLITLVPLLLLFKEIKGLNVKILRSSFIFRGKVPEAKGEDFKFNKFIFLKDVFTANSPQKYKAGKAFKKSPKKKLKIGLLAFSKANR